MGRLRCPKSNSCPARLRIICIPSAPHTLRSTTQNWCGPLLAKGATCTMGCVNEPYLSCTPNVAAFLGRFANGFTFGEAAWAAQPALSWQTTVIGDPFYRPGGKSLAEQHAELAAPTTRSSNGPFCDSWIWISPTACPWAQLANFIENLPATTNSAVLTEKLADLYETQGKPSSAIDTYELALTRHPSPEQRIRIRLALGDKLVAAGRENDAIENYKQLLAESADYPGKPSVEAKMAALEQKLTNTNNAAKNELQAK